ncbi:MAG: membrane-bound lytic murein transglycosylase MltF, partial [Gammaproteobacteria bacterium]|nr:membrane-bound lytic murein transglycosylase MltF [Gammaproteobacteria bacterium]
LGEILPLLEQGEADIAAAGLTRTDERAGYFLFGSTYQVVNQQVVCRRGGKRPGKIEDLEGIELVVPAHSSYVERLTYLKRYHPYLTWRADKQFNTENLLEEVWYKRIECTVADSNIVDINRRYYPELSVRFDISEPEILAWILPKNAEGLQEAVHDWFEIIEEDGTLLQLQEKYYGFIEVFDYVDIRTYIRRIYKVLPSYQKYFKAAAKHYKFDWTLLAAMSYQESHWNSRARSPTGVRGIMMLTLNTAKEMGVQSRFNVEQNIWGGARYLKRMYNRLPDNIPDPDRIYMALAAYNIGYGHLMDARELAKRLDKNPDSWSELAEVLPLLSRKQYYKTLKYGYARGYEPVTYVQRIRDYQDILEKELHNKQNKKH